MKKIGNIKARLLSPEDELKIRVNVGQIKEWIPHCPIRCVAGEFLENYAMLFEAYMILKKHMENDAEYKNKQ